MSHAVLSEEDDYILRANEGRHRLPRGTPCAVCPNPLARAPEYVVRQWRTAAMAAPSFWYYHVGCVPPGAGIDDGRPVEVVFRVWKGDGDDVLALFPNEKETDAGHCTSYQHVGQHAAADYAGCIARSRPAGSEEHAGLRAELEGIGYALRIRRRRGRQGG